MAKLTTATIEEDMEVFFQERPMDGAYIHGTAEAGRMEILTGGNAMLLADMIAAIAIDFASHFPNGEMTPEDVLRAAYGRIQYS